MGDDALHRRQAWKGDSVCPSRWQNARTVSPLDACRSSVSRQRVSFAKSHCLFAPPRRIFDIVLISLDENHELDAVC